MKKILKIGFIGGGINSAVGNTHRIACQMDNRWKIESGCFSRDKENNQKTAELWNVARLYNTWNDLLDGEVGKIDAVCVLTPIPTHYEIIIKALDLGYKVISEKALASSVAEAEAIQKKVEETDGFLAVTYNYTGYPMVRELKQMIAKGKLGKIFHIIAEMPQGGFNKLNIDGSKPIPQEWRLKDGEIPTVSLDLGAHLHNMVNFLTGENYINVVADQSSNGFFPEVVDNVFCIARYTKNLKVQYWYGKSSLGTRNGLRIRIFGELGSAEWFQMESENIKLCDKKGNISIIDRASPSIEVANQDRYNRFKPGHPAGFIEAFANYYTDIADSLSSSYCSSSIYIFDSLHAKSGLEFLLKINNYCKGLNE